MIHLSISLLYLNENDKILVIYCHMWLHKYGNPLEMDFYEQEWPEFETRTSGFKTDRFTIEPLHLFKTPFVLELNIKTHCFTLKSP